MWGENWGEMIWGETTSIVAQIPFANLWFLVAFAIYIIAAVSAVQKFDATRVTSFVVVLSVTPIFAIAVKHIFVSG